MSARGTTLSGVLLVVVSLTPLLFGRVFYFAPDQAPGEVALAGDLLLEEGDNVQTAKLLEASLALGEGEAKGKGGGDISIVDGSALVSEMGPDGTEADVYVKEARPGADEISLYVVRDGDTLDEVAEMFGVTSNTIVWANDLRSKTLKEGQELVILPITGVRHEVKDGETVSGIVKKYGADLDEVLLYNGVSEDEEISEGMVLVLPDGEISLPAPKRSTSSSSGSSSGSGGSWLIKPASGYRSQGIHGYNGIDIAGPVGSNIMAAAGGQIIIARSGSWNGGYGNYVVIKHGNGVQTLYAHLNAVYVSQGQWVSQGQSVGTMGNTGRSTGPHLHFEVRGAGNPF